MPDHSSHRSREWKHRHQCLDSDLTVDTAPLQHSLVHPSYTLVAHLLVLGLSWKLTTLGKGAGTLNHSLPRPET